MKVRNWVLGMLSVVLLWGMTMPATAQYRRDDRRHYPRRHHRPHRRHPRPYRRPY